MSKFDLFSASSCDQLYGEEIDPNSNTYFYGNTILVGAYARVDGVPKSINILDPVWSISNQGASCEYYQEIAYSAVSGVVTLVSLNSFPLKITFVPLVPNPPMVQPVISLTGKTVSGEAFQEEVTLNIKAIGGLSPSGITINNNVTKVGTVDQDGDKWTAMLSPANVPGISLTASFTSAMPAGGRIFAVNLIDFNLKEADGEEVSSGTGAYDGDMYPYQSQNLIVDLATLQFHDNPGVQVMSGAPFGYSFRATTYFFYDNPSESTSQGIIFPVMLTFPYSWGYGVTYDGSQMSQCFLQAPVQDKDMTPPVWSTNYIPPGGNLLPFRL